MIVRIVLLFDIVMILLLVFTILFSMSGVEGIVEIGRT